MDAFGIVICVVFVSVTILCNWVSLCVMEWPLEVKFHKNTIIIRTTKAEHVYEVSSIKEIRSIRRGPFVSQIIRFTPTMSNHDIGMGQDKNCKQPVLSLHGEIITPEHIEELESRKQQYLRGFTHNSTA